MVIDRPGSAQTEIRVGQVAIPRGHPDYLALDIATRILGGEGANRLFAVLRAERGLTYGASADLRAFRTSGALVAETNTRPAGTGETLRLIVDEFARLRRDRVGAAELRGVQDFIAGHFPLSIETPSSIAEQVLARLFYGQHLSGMETYLDRVEAVTPSDVQRVARQWVKPGRLSIVLVGDAARFVDQLRAVGFAEYERIPLSQLDLDSPTLWRAPAAPAAARPGGAPRVTVPSPAIVPGARRRAPRVMISCGEASGDLYAGALATALGEQAPGVEIVGFGGARLRAAGADLIGDYRGFAVTGLVEALAVLPRSWRMLRALGDEARARRPDVFVAIDFPDFNFRLLPVMHALGIPVVYYVSPQLWAWRPRRMRTYSTRRVADARHLSLRGRHLRARGRARRVRRAPARRPRRRTRSARARGCRPAASIPADPSWHCCRAAGRTRFGACCPCSSTAVPRLVAGRPRHPVPRGPRPVAPDDACSHGSPTCPRPCTWWSSATDERAGGRRRRRHRVGNGHRADRAARDARW